MVYILNKLIYMIKYYVMYIIIYITFKLISLPILFKFYKIKYLSNPKDIISFNGKPEILKPQYLKFSSKFMNIPFKESIPVIITDIDPDMIKFINNYLPRNRSKENVLNLSYENPLNIINSKYGKWIMYQSKLPIFHSGVFFGNYKAGQAHIDTTLAYNFYFMIRGVKEVIIVPKGFEKYLNMYYTNQVNVKDDDNKNNDKKWLKKLPYYYRFKLKKNELLIFNNSACIHKFFNLRDNNASLSTRVFNVLYGHSELVLFNMFTNPNTITTGTNYILNKKICNNVN